LILYIRNYSGSKAQRHKGTKLICFAVIILL